jgi:phosphoglycolate phosphatase
LKVILFDIDGTLVKAGGAGIRALNRAVKLVTGKDGACRSFQLQGRTDKINFENAFRAGAGRRPAKKEMLELEKNYKACLPREVEASVKAGKYTKIKGVEKFLLKLSGCRSVLAGLGTGNLKAGAFIKLQPSGLMKYFVFGGYGCDSRSRVGMLKKAVERAAEITKIPVKPGEVYVIGDTPRDVAAAKEAGYHSAAVLAGFGDAREIMRSNPELMAEDFSSLKPWLIWLGLEKDPKGVRRGAYICPDSPIEHAQYGRTGMASRDIKMGIRRLREAKKGMNR